MSSRKGKGKGKGRSGPSVAYVAQSRQSRNSGAGYSGGSRGSSVVIRHTEFLWDHAGSVLFEWDSILLNPALHQYFPWLAAIAGRYEKYRFKKLRVLYRPACPTTTPGRVILAVDHDAADAGPETKQQMLSYFGAQVGAPWEEVALDLLKGVKDEPRFTRYKDLVSNLDVKTYDLGVCYLAAEGQTGTAILGDILLDYEVELLIPQLEDLGGECGYKYIVNAGVTATTPIGTDNAGTRVGTTDLEILSDGSLFTKAGFEGLISIYWSTITALATTIQTGLTTAKAAAMVGSTSVAGNPKIDQAKVILAPGQKVAFQYGGAPSGLGTGCIRAVSGDYAFL